MSYKEKDWLVEHYITKDMASIAIAELSGVGGQTILNWLATHDIPRRNTGVRTKRTSKKQHETKCTNCGKVFYVDMACKADPSNSRKFVRACSRECTSALRARIIKDSHTNGYIKHSTGPRSFIDRSELIRMICYEHKYLQDVAKELRVKSTTLQREIERHNIPMEFYRECPQCNEQFASKMRCQVDPSSNKFRKFCGHKCFLTSRKNTDTWIERVVRKCLEDNNVDFIDQYSIGRMTADFLLPKYNVIIETNGDFWHANPVVYTDESKLHPIQKRAIEKDVRKLRQLYEKGYDVIIVWENDLLHNQSETLLDLLTQIQRKEAV